MAFGIAITDDAERQLRALPVREQRLIEAAVASRLVHQPTSVTRAVKRLSPNPLAQFELRVGELRVLYNVQASEVVLLVVGRKVGERLIVEGEVFYGHQDNPPEPAGD